MSEIYAIVNEKKIRLTEEQVKLLGLKIDNPFMRVAENDKYFFICFDGAIIPCEDHGGDFDNRRYDNVNYFNDKAFAKQVALHQLLYRKLLKFAYENGYEDKEWNGEKHFRVCYNVETKAFEIDTDWSLKGEGCYFNSQEAASYAIKEVIEPFMKEHPDFVW